MPEILNKEHMKNITTILILLFSTFLFSQNQSKEENQDNYIFKIISDLKNQNKISEKPVIVINEKVYKNNNWDALTISKFDIESLSIIKKGQKNLIEVYGNQSINGVILIETKPFDEKIKEDFESYSNALILLDNKEISNSKARKINPDSIENIQIIKNQDSIIKYTSKEVQGIIKITLKNKL